MFHPILSVLAAWRFWRCVNRILSVYIEHPRVLTFGPIVYTLVVLVFLPSRHSL